MAAAVPSTGITPGGGAAGAGMLLPAGLPSVGPAVLPPPYANGTPRCERARAITRSMACWLRVGSGKRSAFAVAAVANDNIRQMTTA